MSVEAWSAQFAVEGCTSVRFTAPMSIPIDNPLHEIILEPHMVGPTTGTSDDAV
jgi:hypothetical protein